MYERWKSGVVLALVLAAPLAGQRHQSVDDGADPPSGAGAPPSSAAAVLASVADGELRSLLADALNRNPELAQARSRARGAELRAPQVRGLPDPRAGVTAWLDGPETRTGPQVLTLSWMQGLPWFGKRDLREQVAWLEASALRLEVEAARLALVTEVRRLYYELAFLSRHEEVTRDFLDHLEKHEELSRVRYSTGSGSSQDVVKMQAEITLAESLLLDIDQRRVDLEAKINRLRDRTASSVVVPSAPPPGEEVVLDFGELLERAERQRPEVAAEDFRIAAAELRVELAEKAFRPDFEVGLTYTFVDTRSDPAGVLVPPEGNGDDIFGVQGGITVPLWRTRRRAGVEEAKAHELTAMESRRTVMAAIESEVGDLMQRIPLTWRQVRLLSDILVLQAEESVESAEASYVSGAANALDLLDAEHVLFDAQTAIARSQADYAIRLAQLEGVVAGPLVQTASEE